MVALERDRLPFLSKRAVMLANSCFVDRASISAAYVLVILHLRQFIFYGQQLTLASHVCSLQLIWE